MFRIGRVFLIFACFVFAAPSHAAEITVSAAASLKDVLTTIGKLYQRSHPATKIAFNFGSSGALQQQIAAGAPVDLFIAAAAQNVDDLASMNAVEVASRRIIARNQLVLIVPRGRPKIPLAALRAAPIRTIAVGAPSVPAGRYARQALNKAGLMAAIAPKLVNCKDVRAVLRQVEAGNADAGFVYRTDVLRSKRAVIAVVFPSNFHEPIVYSMALVAQRHNAAARDFWSFLQRSAARQQFRRAGFGAPH